MAEYPCYVMARPHANRFDRDLTIYLLYVARPPYVSSKPILRSNSAETATLLVPYRALASGCG